MVAVHCNVYNDLHVCRILLAKIVQAAQLFAKTVVRLAVLLLTDGAQETATARWWGAAHSCRPHAEDGCGYSGHQASAPSLVFVSLMIGGDQCEVLDSGHWSEQVFLNLDGVKNCSLLGRVALQHGAADVGRWCGCGVPVPAELSALL